MTPRDTFQRKSSLVFVSILPLCGHISISQISIDRQIFLDNSPEVPFQAKCAPPIRDVPDESTVQIEEVEEESDLLVPDAIGRAIEAGMSPLMQERLKRARDTQANMVDGIVVPKKKAKAKPAAKVGNGSASSKD